MPWLGWLCAGDLVVDLGTQNLAVVKPAVARRLEWRSEVYESLLELLGLMSLEGSLQTLIFPMWGHVPRPNDGPGYVSVATGLQQLTPVQFYPLPVPPASALHLKVCDTQPCFGPCCSQPHLVCRQLWNGYAQETVHVLMGAVKPGCQSCVPTSWPQLLTTAHHHPRKKPPTCCL